MRNWRLALACALCGALLAFGSIVTSLVADQTRWDVPALNYSRVPHALAVASPAHVSGDLWSADGLPVVVVSGSPREMGRRYGQAVSDLIHRGMNDYLYKRVIQDQGYSMEYLLECARAMLPHIAPEYVEEMKGVAEGAGVTFDQVLAMHAHADVVHYGHDWGKQEREPGQAAGCSNFAAWGPLTVDGALIHGRNLDWTIGSGVQESAVVYVGIPQRGHPFALVTYAGMIGAVTGMSARGITFGEMTSQTGDETLAGEPLFIVCRRILQYSDDIESAMQIVRDYPGTTGWNFIIASGPEHTARACEVDAGDKVIMLPDDPGENDPPLSKGHPNALYRTNHPTSPLILEKVARKYGITNLELGKVLLRSLETWQRYETLRLWTTDRYAGKIDERAALAMLQSEPISAGNTLHSVVFVPERLSMWVANASALPDPRPAWDEAYHLIDLGELVKQAGAR